MDVEIVAIDGHGYSGEEHVTLRAVAGCNIGKYILADTNYVADGRISNELRHVYWFPDGRVEKDDTIILRTGVGSNHEEMNRDGTITHHFYWGLRVPVWNDTGDYAVLIKVNDWAARASM